MMDEITKFLADAMSEPSSPESEGYRAYWAGKAVDSHNFKSDSEESRAFEKGWKDAQDTAIRG